MPGFRPCIIEHQLARTIKEPNGRACNRTAELVERMRMMPEWADSLDGFRAGNVVQLRRGQAA